ncbi:MAG: hypothetical protein COW01_04535 [Bdellovibrionales bacterium CG12_big_fil_rev_8_21_14_0_65_38_15]|nr:MAG: hypothetical protein COW79_11855 [Bdellovibrionales bacterium CG22_combo_CG10-13_8_21_14_all_38_13]PIQ56325.1 MAG: hypothetical protein COW01_04535 [Bdellovibrionales bacterium CG12_big_fil_rev_8_21_14_0_65_38_15]PIR29356.1 MAG: hypothetical protein COV38_11470 [Bdellovibrionales bacterium CG11_big_fil_rev_8_21_14_0_20_38_13]
MKSLIFVLTLFIATLSQAKMVFLAEGPLGKHVGVSTDNSTYKLLTGGESWNLYPTISSDGSKIAYANGTSASDLVLTVKDLNTREVKRLTSPGFVLQPMFSKNGTRVFFSHQVDGINHIAYKDLNSADSIQYVTKDHQSFFPAPFQSGEMIIYQRNREGQAREIVMLDLLSNSNNEEVIGLGMAPALSKDEQFIAYTSKVDGNWDIYIYNRFTKETKRVTFDSANDFSPTFDRVGNLIYTSDRLENGVFSIFSQDLNSWSTDQIQEKLLITKTGTSFYAPRISGIESYSTIQMPKLIGTPRSSFGTINHQGNIYVVGGHQGAEHTYPPESFTGRMTGYNIASKTWKDLAPRPNKAHGYQLAAHGKYLYAFGGFAYEASTNPKWKSIDTVDRYNIETGLWEEVTPMPRRRSSNVVVQIGLKVYLIGGWDATPKFDNDIDGTFHDQIDVFDLVTLKWATLETKLPKKRRAFSGFSKDGVIYLVGGISQGGSHFSLSDDFTKFNPQTGEFSDMPKLPFGTFAPAAGSIGNKAFMFGGMFKTGTFNYEYVPHIYQFDFETNMWTHSGRYLNEYKGFSQVIQMNSCLAILGGHSYKDNTDSPVDTFETFCSK